MTRLRAVWPGKPWEAGSPVRYASVSTIAPPQGPDGVSRISQCPSSRGATILAEGSKKLLGSGTKSFIVGSRFLCPIVSSNSKKEKRTRVRKASQFQVPQRGRAGLTRGRGFLMFGSVRLADLIFGRRGDAMAGQAQTLCPSPESARRAGGDDESSPLSGHFVWLKPTVCLW